MAVLLGYLPTPQGEAAFARALQEAALRSTTLVVVNSARTGALVDPALADDADLARLRAAADAAGVPVEIRQPVAEHGAAADQLIDASAEEGVDLLVIGLRRRSAVGKFVLGSSAQRVLMEAHAPVLAVKA
ncbi:universal stress protein [Micromonospora sp. ATA32]|nr:universal stress protein [Micromonospora sp. ATA32]